MVVPHHLLFKTESLFGQLAVLNSARIAGTTPPLPTQTNHVEQATLATHRKTSTPPNPPVPPLVPLAQPFTTPLPSPNLCPSSSTFAHCLSLLARTALPHTSHTHARKTARRSTIASAATPRTTATPGPSLSAPTTRPPLAPPATAAPRSPRRPAPSAAASTPPRPLRRTRPHSSGAPAAAAAAGTTGMAGTVWGTLGMVGGS
jgi:hypothetical protein